MRTTVCLALLLLLCTCDPAPDNAEVVTTPPETDGKSIEIQRVPSTMETSPNPAAPGFNAAASDKRAIALADSIVAAHGGRATYDATRFFRWNFFGARNLFWDKQEQRVRIEVPEENAVYLLSYAGDTLSGRVRVKGDEITDPAALAEALGKAHSMFINDSYWLVQPFKLKDSGVTLKQALGMEMDPLANRPSHVLDMTFEGVGDTPGNRYRLFVDGSTYRINTWQFFRDAADTEPAMQTPWLDYKPYNGLWLSGDRGGRFVLGDIVAGNQLRDEVFTQF